MEMTTSRQTGAGRASCTRLNLRELMPQPTSTSPGLASTPPQQESTLLSRWTGRLLMTSGIIFILVLNIVRKKQTSNYFCGHYVYIAILDSSPQTIEANLRTLLCPKFCHWWGSWTIQLGSFLLKWNTMGSMPPWLWKVLLNFIWIYYSGTALESSKQADSKTVPGFVIDQNL